MHAKFFRFFARSMCSSYRPESRQPEAIAVGPAGGFNGHFLSSAFNNSADKRSELIIQVCQLQPCCWNVILVAAAAYFDAYVYEGNYRCGGCWSKEAFFNFLRFIRFYPLSNSIRFSLKNTFTWLECACADGKPLMRSISARRKKGFIWISSRRREHYESVWFCSFWHSRQEIKHFLQHTSFTIARGPWSVVSIRRRDRPLPIAHWAGTIWNMWWFFGWCLLPLIERYDTLYFWCGKTAQPSRARPNSN